ncbi:hypothetical protein FRB95_012149 [Tulasnella sp. JGI-2019a]|nr:hypothetical protein FRB93_008372 [Tulasnella sp. JGI-2019a]KAG9024040.1 hypothetical protein FRB95_012149 [Tulasnella sp. JGI-2019a]
MIPPLLATEEFQHISSHIDDPFDILSFSSTCVTLANILWKDWVWTEHLRIDTTSLYLPTEESKSTVTRWKNLARFACSLFVVRTPLAGSIPAGEGTAMLALESAIGESYLRKLDLVTASIGTYSTQGAGFNLMQTLLQILDAACSAVTPFC